MNRKTETALRGSIRKWQGIVDGTVEDEGVRNCPLCRLFFDNDCEGCPVSEDTGETYCDGSPFEVWSELGSYGRHGWTVDGADSFVAACFELEYLKSLLPKRGGKK